MASMRFAFVAPVVKQYELVWPTVPMIGTAAVLAGLLAALAMMFLPISAVDAGSAHRGRHALHPATLIGWLLHRISTGLSRPAGALMLMAAVIALSVMVYVRA